MTTTAAKGTRLIRAERAEPVIKFLLLPALAYGLRLALIGGLVLAALVLQVAFLSMWAGLPLLVPAVLLGWIRGYDNRLDFRSYHHAGEWKRTEIDRIAQVLEQDKRMQKWDESAFDFTNWMGCLTLAAAVFVLGVGTILLMAYSPPVAGILAMDGLALLVLSWFSGMRSVHRKPDLVLKAKHVDKVLRALPASTFKRGEFLAQLLLQGEGEQQIPADFKLLVEFKESPPGFYGVQGQVVINRVQGAGYPYFYACIVARDELQLLDVLKRKPKLPNGVILEQQRKDGVQVIVIRQYTTSTSGYHTKEGTSISILITALEITELFLKTRAARKAG